MGRLPFRKTLEILLLSLGLLLFVNSFRLLGKPAANAGVEALPHQYKLAYTALEPSGNAPMAVDKNTVSSLAALPTPNSDTHPTPAAAEVGKVKDKTHTANNPVKNIQEAATSAVINSINPN